MRIHRFVLPIVMTALVAGSAAADPAAEAVARAKKAFKEERYADAIADFRVAYAAKKDPKILYAIAQAQRMAGDCEGAIESYKEFLASKPDKKLKEYSQANIDRCKEDLAKKPPPPKEPTPPPPAPEPTPPAPGPTTAGSPPAPAPSGAPLPAGPVDRGASGGRSWTKDWVGHGLVAGGVVAGGVGAFLWLSGRSEASGVNDETDYQSFVDARDAASSALTKQRIGIGLGIAGAALIVGGVVHYKVGNGRKEARVTAVPTRGGAAVYAGVSF